MSDEGHLIPPDLVEGITKMYAEVLISRELLNPPPPTEGERAAHHAAKVEAWRLYDAARPALAAIDDPLARAILDLHAADTEEHPECEGCEFGGYDAEAPEWPCSTVRLVAEHFGIELPDGGYLWRRPEATA
jgi:hypothetical protein